MIIIILIFFALKYKSVTSVYLRGEEVLRVKVTGGSIYEG